MAFLLLLGAILSEVAGTIATRFSDGFTRPLPSMIVVVGIVLAYYLFSLTLKSGTNIGVAYSIWAGLGVSLVALIGALFLGDSLSRVQAVGIGFVIAGIFALQLGAPAN